MRHATATVAAVSLVAVLVSGCQALDQLTDTSAAAGATGVPAGVSLVTARDQLAHLEVRPEDTGHLYEREDWPHWPYVGDGCDTRDIVLREQGSDLVAGKGCEIPSGRWVSAYDGQVVTDPSELDIDHIVPLAEANRSGVRDWTETDRERFANDTAHLVAVTASSNREKADQDPAEWLPERDRCGYVIRWIATKHAYGLTVDTEEHRALSSVLGTCGGGR